ncbi:MAG: type II toxin-antitoxin system prevent-host-death family antitoxin [Acidobacteria bacterium]|nr:type II toxin-antitoxin system prevent-host-death family antitoxin [Acidobacteriota bacterium]
MMKSVNIGELKNRLSTYLNRVKTGDEIIVRDRDRPVARIVPMSAVGDDDAQLAALAAVGLVCLGDGPLDEAFWQLLAPRVRAAALRRAISEERNDG